MLDVLIGRADRDAPSRSRLPPNCSAFAIPWPPRASAVFPVNVDPWIVSGLSLSRPPPAVIPPNLPAPPTELTTLPRIRAVDDVQGTAECFADPAAIGDAAEFWPGSPSALAWLSAITVLAQASAFASLL